MQTMASRYTLDRKTFFFGDLIERIQISIAEKICRELKLVSLLLKRLLHFLVCENSFECPKIIKQKQNKVFSINKVRS